MTHMRRILTIISILCCQSVLAVDNSEVQWTLVYKHMVSFEPVSALKTGIQKEFIQMIRLDPQQIGYAAGIGRTLIYKEIDTSMVKINIKFLGGRISPKVVYNFEEKNRSKLIVLFSRSF